MVHITVTAPQGDDGVEIGRQGISRETVEALTSRLERLGPKVPVVILIHGYRFNPAHSGRDPGRLLYAFRPEVTDNRIVSWPAGLGFDEDDPARGLCIGFGWPASASHLETLLSHGHTGFGRVYRKAAGAALVLADLIETIQRLAPGRPVDLVAHSLGARVALAALPHLESPPGRIILMGAAEFASAAHRNLAAMRAGAAPEIYNITARGNAFYDGMFETFAPGRLRGDRAIGCGLPEAPGYWLDLQIDAPHVTRRLRRRGVDLAPARRRPCHWSFYTRGGAFGLYRAILARQPGWDVANLRNLAARPAPASRWSGLVEGFGFGPEHDVDLADVSPDLESA